MIDQEQTDKFKEILRLSKNILVVFPETKSLDLFLASYCLFSFLAKASEVRFLTPKFKQKLPKEIVDLIKQEKIETEMGKENLLISFPYLEEQVDKVSYFIGEQDKRFYLTIKPKSGTAPLDGAKVEFSYAGTQADLLVLCGVEDLESLDQLFFAYENLYKDSNNHLVTLNSFIPDFGNLNLDISPSTSYCEAVFYLLKDLDDEGQDLLAKSDLATLLLYGIEAQTSGLQAPSTKPSTFLAVAELLELGGARLFRLTTKEKDKDSANGSSKVSKVTAPPQIHSVK